MQELVRITKPNKNFIWFSLSLSQGFLTKTGFELQGKRKKEIKWHELA
jgi:hypothetical protein